MDHRRNNPKAISTSIPKQQTASRAIGSRLSTQQKLMLERLMNKAQNGRTSLDSKEQQWSKIAHQLNQVPGARKSWMQWRQTWSDIKKNAKKSQSQLLYDSDKLVDRDWSIPDETVSDEICINSASKKVKQCWPDTDNSDDGGDNAEYNAISNRISKQQKATLEQLMNNPHNPADSIRKHWSIVAHKLNQLPGARKTWMQWKFTWRDIKKNAKKSTLPHDSDEFANKKPSNSNETISDKMCISNTSSAAKDIDSDDDADDNKEFSAKQRRARNMSMAQKKLMCELVSSNAILQKHKFDGSKSACLSKREEWKKIAKKLNSVKGPQKTRTQWKRCWLDIQKHYVQRDADDQFLETDSDLDMSDTDAGDSTRSRVNSTEQSECAPSATQLSCLIRNIAEHQNETNINTWTSLSNTLNDLGPCVKDCRGWKRTWNDHKSKIQKLVVESGTKNLDKLQRLTYACIKRERKKTDCASNILNEQQLQLLQHTAGEECNTVGSLVAAKLRSMVKEQKLIAEKLISEVLFQGQMEMFRYSNEAVNIPGYF